ncbi:hypothetical protein PMAYCL1PPCAC_23422, partial [Pristionchus mayeri]
EMFDEDAYEDMEESPMQSQMDGGYDETGGRAAPSPPQSVVESIYDEEYEEEEVDDEGGRRGGRNLSTVKEDDEEMEEEEREMGREEREMSASFVSGAKAIERINADEEVRRKKQIFIQNDPRFDRSYNPKENSWEPSPYQSRIEEKEGDKENYPLAGENEPILSHVPKAKSTSKSVKFSETTETRDVSPLVSSDSATSALDRPDERMDSRVCEAANMHTQRCPPSVPSSSRLPPPIPPPVSPSESVMSTNSSVFVSTPNQQLSKQQATRSLRARFSDISAIDAANSSGNQLPSSSRAGNRQREEASPSRSTVPTLTDSEIINAIRSGNDSEDIQRKLASARTKESRVKKVNIMQGEMHRQSSIHAHTYSSPPLSTTFVTSTRRENEERREERLPDVAPSRRETEGRREESRREVRDHHHPISHLPPRPPLRPTQNTGDVLQKNVTNTSTISSVSNRSARSERGESRAESVASTTSQKSSASSRRERGGVLSTETSEIDFGYVVVGDEKVVVFKARNNLDHPITCRLSVNSMEKMKDGKRTGPTFKIMDGTEVTVEGGAHLEVPLRFTPPQEAKFTDRLAIQLIGGGISQKYGITIHGLGGRASLGLVMRDGLYVHRSGEFVFSTESTGAISLAVENKGKRSAYVRMVVMDGYGNRVEGAVFFPSHSFVVLANQKQPFKVDMSHARVNESGRSSSLSNNGGMGFRRSSTSSLNSIGSSASSGSRHTPTYTIKLYWGEESQRHRMIAWCRSQSHTCFPPCSPVSEDFSGPFVGEEKNPHIDQTRKLKKFDCDYFIASLRAITVNVHISGVHAAPIEEYTDHDRTLVPDNTFRGGLNDTMVSMAADLTAMRIKK